MSYTLRPALPLRPAVLAVIAFHAGFVLLLLLNLDRVPGAKPEVVTIADYFPEAPMPNADPSEIPQPNLDPMPLTTEQPDVPYDGPIPEGSISAVPTADPIPVRALTPIVWTRPQILERTQIPYPTIGSIKPEGTVRLRLRIGVTGRPIEVSIGTSSGFAELDRAALKAVARWRFKPRLLDGNPVESWVEMPIVFQLRD
jgi:protein TonB